ncbi:replication/maintenance protein RepL [Dyadobacter sp. CY312]|uniref:replication/maintenance protein RepL n=1 Tax=Dyadobacter sp. CY312 TaxID=2907303 RepID=UPI001F269E53|nr:replication/maintenance protein RepL [Dyadobacter sp. CY312]MCE7038979.1 replication/maintenance protein RepL [Dyadobacter sp. CY312]
MNKYTKPEVNEGELTPNPFLKNLEIPITEFKSPNQFTKKGDEYEPVQKRIEYTPFGKMYCSSERRLAVNKLSLRAKELLLWIIYEVSHGQSYLWINHKRFQKEQGIKSLNTYKGAVKELVDNKFLSVTSIDQVYHINPHYLFKGDRLKKFKDKVVKKN